MIHLGIQWCFFSFFFPNNAFERQVLKVMLIDREGVALFTWLQLILGMCSTVAAGNFHGLNSFNCFAPSPQLSRQCTMRAMPDWHNTLLLLSWLGRKRKCLCSIASACGCDSVSKPHADTKCLVCLVVWLNTKHVKLTSFKKSLKCWCR